MPLTLRLSRLENIAHYSGVNMKKRQTEKISLTQKVIFILFKLLERLSCKLAGYFLYILWHMPWSKRRKRNRVFPEDTIQSSFNVAGKRIPYWESGSGPVVLFVHGWGSYGAQFSLMINEFHDSGYKTIWFDAPAHGEATGLMTNVFEVNECISCLQEKYGHFELVIGHSFGAFSLMRAVSEGLSISRLIVLSLTTSAAGLVDKFCNVFNAKEQTRYEMMGFIEKKYGNNIWEKLSSLNMAKLIHQPVLLIHDKCDSVVSCKESISTKRKLSNAKLILTERLGHNRILYDTSVMKAIFEFIGASKVVE